MMASDNKLRQYLFGAVVTVLITTGSCLGKNLLDRIGTLEAHDGDRAKDNATVKQELEDFRKAFEDFRKEDSEWKQNHHDGPR